MRITVRIGARISVHFRRNAQHQADYLLPLVFVTPNRMLVCRPVPFREVAGWSLRVGHSPYRSIHIDELKPLKALTDLLAYPPIEEAMTMPTTTDEVVVVVGAR